MSRENVGSVLRSRQGERVVLKEELSHQVTSIEAGMIAQIRYLTDWSEALDACGRSNAA